MIKALFCIVCVILSCVQNSSASPSSNRLDVSTMSGAQISELLEAQLTIIATQHSTITTQGEQIASLRHQLDWFRRQVFGKKSERFVPEPDPAQLHLGEVLPIPAESPEKVKAISAHTRRVAQKDGAQSAEELPFFDESSVPLESIVLVHEEAQGLESGEYELIGEKISYRLERSMLKPRCMQECRQCSISQRDGVRGHAETKVGWHQDLRAQPRFYEGRNKC